MSPELQAWPNRPDAEGQEERLPLALVQGDLDRAGAGRASAGPALRARPWTGPYPSTVSTRASKTGLSFIVRRIQRARISRMKLARKGIRQPQLSSSAGPTAPSRTVPWWRARTRGDTAPDEGRTRSAHHPAWAPSVAGPPRSADGRGALQPEERLLAGRVRCRRGRRGAADSTGVGVRARPAAAATITRHPRAWSHSRRPGEAAGGSRRPRCARLTRCPLSWVCCRSSSAAWRSSSTPAPSARSPAASA